MNEQLRNARMEANFTQEQLAKEAGISKTNYQYIEYGKVIPSVKVAIKISRAVGKQVEELFDA